MPTDITTIVQSIQAHAWYPAAAGVITLLLALFRRVAPATWDRLPRRWQWVPAVLVATLGAFVDGYAQGAPWGVALALAGYAAVTAGLAAVGLVHVTKRVTGSGTDGSTPADSAAPPTAPPSTLRSGAVGLVFLAIGLLGALTLTGCAGTFEEARLAGAPASAPAAPSPADVAYCRDLDSSRTTWGAVAKGSAALAGASGLATLPVDSERGRLALGGATLAVGAVSVVAVYVSESKGAAWVRDCSH